MPPVGRGRREREREGERERERARKREGTTQKEEKVVSIGEARMSRNGGRGC